MNFRMYEDVRGAIDDGDKTKSNNSRSTSTKPRTLTTVVDVLMPDFVIYYRHATIIQCGPIQCGPIDEARQPTYQLPRIFIVLVVCVP